jgi:predicted nucleic acid-binding Zn ribbon protein
MSDTQITWDFIRRTLERLNMVAAKVHAKSLAEELALRACTELPPYDYLSDVFEHLRKIADPWAHPNGACRQCGESIGRDHNGARFCSDRCRQRAYRLRLKQRGQGSKRNARSNGDASSDAGARANVTRTVRPLAASNAPALSLGATNDPH